MSTTSEFSSDPFAQWSEALTCLFAAGVVLLGVFMWSGLTGQHDRAVYLGQGPALNDGVVLRTDRPARYVMPDGVALAELKPGCRYDFNYANGHKGDRKSRYVRSATLVDCFISGALAMRFDPGSPALWIKHT